MGLTFPRVPTISPGAAVTSAQLAAVADALNARDRSGLGDGPWRRANYVFTGFRQIRNGDGLLSPAQAEFFTTYQNVDPQEDVWPVAAAGDPEGANVASILPAFVFGTESGNMFSEELRISDPPSGGLPLWLGLTIPETPEELWELGKQQRGAIDPDTGALASPSFTAATEHLKIQPHLTSMHGLSWGGHMAAPARGLDCTDTQFNNYLIFFTNLNDASIQAYDGTCPDEITHIAGVGQGSRNYYVYKNDGNVDVLPLKDWIIGPFTGGSWVMKQSGEHIPRFLNAFVDEFRGTEDQRGTQETWLQHAFDTQRFLTFQYHLAPQIGTEVGADVDEEYPRWEATGSTTFAAGAVILKVGGATEYTYTEGFVMVSAWLKATGLVGSVEIDFFESGDRLKSVTLIPDGTGEAQLLVMFEQAVTPNPLQIRWGSAATFTSTAGTLEIETTEILIYKPELHDLYLCLRLASCNTSLTPGGLDGSGEWEQSADIISDNYFAQGCVTNIYGAPGPEGSASTINTNSVFDTARRMSKGVRILPRENFIGYEVSGGKSICYFTREGIGGVDLFDGIAPPRESIDSGGIRIGVEYVVRSGSVIYNHASYGTAQRFIGISGVVDYVGDGAVYEYDGIRHTALREDWTNEWLMGQQLKVYHPDEANIFTPDVHADWRFLSERCHFYYGGTIPNDLRAQFSYGDSVSLSPELPTGWRYAKGTNRWLCTEGDTDCENFRRNRYKSCRIYEPDPEIESAIVLIEDTVEIVKLTFTTRFHHHDDAPASIARDIGAWDLTALTAEANEYRTVENGLREYLRYQDDGTHCTKGSPLNISGEGNAAYNSLVWSILGDPYGACFPYFYFVQLMQKPYEDGNSTQDSHDTPLLANWWREAELRIRVMCEGCVDGLTSANIGCETGISALFDYNLASLCFEAFGGRWFSTLPTVPSAYIEESETRSDAPQGFGQLSNTILSSEVYNQFAAAINLMNRYRVMLPMQLQTRERIGSATMSVLATAGYGGLTPPTCTPDNLVQGAYWTGTPPSASAGSPGAWTDDSTINSQVGGGIVCDGCDGDNWIVETNRVDTDWRWNYADTDAMYAVPEAWRDMVETNAQLLGLRHTLNVTTEVATAPFDESQECHFVHGHWWDGTNYLKFVSTDVETFECVIIPASGTISAAPAGASDFAIGRTAASVACCQGGSSSSISITPILGNDTAFIEVPLV